MMNDCADGNMRDRLPEYVHGTLSVGERATVAAHLEGCEDCRAEVELIEAAVRAIPVPTIDIARIVNAMPRSRKAEAGSRFLNTGWRAAAAIGIVAIGAYSVAQFEKQRAPARQQVAVATPLASSTTPQRAPAITPSPKVAPARADSTSATPAQVAQAAVVTSGQPAMSFGGGLSDLSDEQLDALLGELDGLDALPSVEPETHLTPILPPDGGHGER
ncbi:MAG: zf-HC2 domain-containing protein [Gemmatimonadaceae bacterium]